MTPSPRIQEVARDGLVLDVRDTGPLDGEPVVLLHGFPQRASSWDAVAPLLHEAGLRTLAVDQRGYAPRARPRPRSAYAVRHAVGDLLAVLDRLGGRAHVVGHDWGAVLGWAAAAGHPGQVRTLTAVSVPHPRAMRSAALRGGQLLRSWYMLAFQLPVLPERVLAGPTGLRLLRGTGMTPDLLERYRREVVATGALRGGLHWYRALPLSGLADAGPVRVPTTMVWSDHDTAIGRVAAEAADRHVAAAFSFVELPGVSHWVPEHAPAAVARAVVDRVRGTRSPG